MNLLLMIALLLYLAGAIYSLITFARQERGRSLTLLTMLALGFASHSSWLTMRWVELEHFPIVSPKEAASFIAWAIVAYYLIIGPRYQARALPAFVLPFVCLFTLTSLLLPESDQPISVALANAISISAITQVIFPVHVTLVIFAYAAFIVTFVSGVMYLVQEHELKAKNFGGTFQRLPALNTSDELSYRSLTIGFALLTLGILTGIIWNQQRDGRYWHNDPKEVLSLVTWLIYLTMIHYRLTAGWRGRRVAWLSIAGFVVVLFTWVGTRFMGGYHIFG
ncbi:MAG: cytochrome c biogenesis protein CcsA [Blastocatellia bacterium]